jgi:hypothetical protein
MRHALATSTTEILTHSPRRLRWLLAIALAGPVAACGPSHAGEGSTVEPDATPAGSGSGATVSITLPTALGGGTATTRLTPHTSSPGKHGLGIPLPIPKPPITHVVPSPDALPASVDISGGAPPVGDQGDTGSCQSWAPGYSALGWWANHVGLASATFAPMYVYAQLVQGNCANGSYVEAALSIMQAQGIETTSDYEPMQQALDCATQPSTLQTANAASFKISGYTQLDLSGGARTAIETTLASGKPAILSIVVYSEFENANPNGFLIGPPVTGDTSYGGHAITAFAYDANGVWIENQWGTDWGTNGWGELSWDFIEGSFAGTPNVGDVATIDGLAFTCSDSNASCSGWAQDSQCQENPDYMLSSCCASCANAGLSYQEYSFETAVDTASCMDVWQSGTADHTKLDEYSCNGTVAQVFTVLDGGHGVISLYNPNSNKCVDVNQDDNANGTQLQIYDCNGTPAQSFYATWYTNGSVTFEKTDVASCIDVDHQNTANGTKVQVWGCNGTVAQSWYPVAP